MTSVHKHYDLHVSSKMFSILLSFCFTYSIIARDIFLILKKPMNSRNWKRSLLNQTTINDGKKKKENHATLWYTKKRVKRLWKPVKFLSDSMMPSTFGYVAAHMTTTNVDATATSMIYVNLFWLFSANVQ